MSYAKMRPDDKKFWLEALRGKAYRQCRGHLYDPMNDAHCCIGVGARAVHHMDCLGKDTEAAVAVLRLDEIAAEHLIDMNDIHENSFAEIADWIQENL